MAAKKKTASKSSKKATASKSPAKKSGKKKASKKKAAAKPASKKSAGKKSAGKKAASAKAEAEPSGKAKKSGASSMDVNLGQVFALRPRVETSFRPADFTTARQQLRADTFDSPQEAARAVAEKALELTHGGPPRTGGKGQRW